MRGFRGFVVGTSVIAAMTAVPGGAQASEFTDYVALGDSRAAAPSTALGPGPDGCRRGMGGYPTLVAHAIRPTRFVDVSCSGATSPEVIVTPQVTMSADGRTHHVPPQVNALGPDTTLVTLSIGGNDMNWWELIAPCFQSFAGRDAQCRTDPVVTAPSDAKLAVLPALVDANLHAIKARSPRATIVVVGHGGIYGLGSCPAAAVSVVDAVWVRDFFARIDRVLQYAAGKYRARFVDVQAAAAGHDACASARARWFEGNVTTSDTPARHPTPTGSQAIAQLVLTALRHR